MENEPNLQASLAALLSRKFIVAVLALLLVTFAVPVEGQAKLEFMRWIVGFFLGANVAQKATLTVLGKK